MATAMEADVDQRLSMSLDDLIASKKKAAPKSASGKKAGAGVKAGAGAGAIGTASAKQPAVRRRKGAKDKQPAAATAKPAAGGVAKKVAAKKRGGRGSAGTGLGVRVQALKNAPKQLAKAAASALNAATAMVTGTGRKANGVRAAKPKGGGRGRGRGGQAGRQQSVAPVADLRVTIQNKLHGRGGAARAGGGGGRGGGRQNKDGVRIPTGW